jgi:tetratricopeptide (TPR) repeat protein
MNAEQMLKAWQAELARHKDGDRRLQAVIGVGTSLSAMGRYVEALAVLDGSPLNRPSPDLMSVWLNNRGYLLAMLNRADEALPHLEDAALLVDARTPAGHQIAGCIVGTRGIALLHLGRLDEAEKELFRALEISREAVAADGNPRGAISRTEGALTAERWYWLAEIARRQDRRDEARRRLKIATAGEGPFAARASASLRTL